MAAQYTIDQLKDIITPIAKQYGVESISLFGSYSKGNPTDQSDVDLKVEKGRYLKLSEPVKIAKITRDDRIIYNVMVQASPKLCTGEAVFSVRLKEGRGNGTEEETFTVKTVGGDK